MRGEVDRQGRLFFMMQIEEFIPEQHPLRSIKKRVDQELQRLAATFEEAYSKTGRPSIPPERLVKATLLQALFSIRSERQLVEQIGYNMLFRWFLDMRPDDQVFNATTFTKNRQRLADFKLMEKFFDRTVARAIKEEAVSSDHFSVDGTLIEAYGSMKSIQSKKGPDDEDLAGGSAPADSNGWANFKGDKRNNATHESKTDPEARLMRKGLGKESRLSHSMHAMTENRHGLIVDIRIEEANGTAERDVAKAMVSDLPGRHGLKPRTLGADKGYDAGPFLEGLESLGVKPHVAIRDGAIKAGRSPGFHARRRARRRKTTMAYQVSQIKRRLAEPVFGWLKTVAGLARTPFVGRWKTQLFALAAAAAFNLLRLAKIGTT